MNGIVILTDRYTTNENGNIATDGNITITNITTDYINLNLGGVRSLSVFDELNNKATFIDVLCLSGVIYNNNNSVISYENANNNTSNLIIHKLVMLSGLIYAPNNSVISYENANNNTMDLIDNGWDTLSNLIYRNNNSVISYEILITTLLI